MQTSQPFGQFLKQAVGVEQEEPFGMMQPMGMPMAQFQQPQFDMFGQSNNLGLFNYNKFLR